MSKKNNENTVPWNFETPIGMRDAIVRAYVPHMAEGDLRPNFLPFSGRVF
jgi:hypothetical protein